MFWKNHSSSKNSAEFKIKHESVRVWEYFSESDVHFIRIWTLICSQHSLILAGFAPCQCSAKRIARLCHFVSKTISSVKVFLAWTNALPSVVGWKSRQVIFSCCQKLFTQLFLVADFLVWSIIDDFWSQFCFYVWICIFRPMEYLCS